MDRGTTQVPEAPKPAPSWEAAGTPTASLRRRNLADLLARWVVSAGGIAIIASVLGILVFICWEVRPLLLGASANARPSIPLSASARIVGAGVDEHETFGFVITAEGNVEYFPLQKDVAAPAAVPLQGAAGKKIQSVYLPSASFDAALGTSDGFVLPLNLRFDIEFDSRGEKPLRLVSPNLKEGALVALDPAGKPIVSLARISGSRGTATAGVTAEGKLLYLAIVEKESVTQGTERTEHRRDLTSSLPGPATVLAMDHRLENLYVGTATGHIAHFDLNELSDPRFLEAPQAAFKSPGAITALGLLIGDQSLIVGDAGGGVRVWFQVENPGSDRGRSLRPVHEFPKQSSQISSIASSARTKGFAAADASGAVTVRHATSEQTLLSLQGAASPVTYAVMSPKANGLYTAHANGTVSRWAVDNPHPETTLRTLFGATWYEGYPGPDFVWQSGSGSDDFEPKLSLIPLLIGTFKGTLFALIIAVPLSILGALYTSQFMHPMMRSYVKPTVEVMAALPSVVLGFIAGLWLAPILERIVPAVFMMFLVLPLSCLGAMHAYRLLPGNVRHVHGEKLQILFLIPALLTAGWICLQLNGVVETLFFSGDFRQWLHTMGIRFDPNNALVVGIAMGFAVIPIIFTISEDALTNVPRHLSSGSLALGATRWQTAVKVVLPAALPGIFSAVMIGLGRAVGETMIVLMATGNTATLDLWNPFTGFRTLSANIAVEAPEAPQGSTLYRTLFLGALLLFIATFIVNTIAEVVRQRMRRRYAQL